VIQCRGAISQSSPLPIGPLKTFAAALEMLGAVVAGAILEAQLPDGDAPPVAKVFKARGVPMVFQSETDLPLMVDRRSRLEWPLL
jgi:hypothetical protein